MEATGSRAGHSEHSTTRQTERSHVLPYATVCVVFPSRVYASLSHYHSESRFFSQESYSKADIDPTTGKPLDVGISGIEGKGSAKGNAGFFEKGLMSALESNHLARGVYREVKVVANGHSHGASALRIAIYVDSDRIFISVTENCRRVKGIWMCFGGGGCVLCLQAQNLCSPNGFTSLDLIPVMEGSASIVGSGSSRSPITARPSGPTSERNTTKSSTGCP